MRNYQLPEITSWEYTANDNSEDHAMMEPPPKKPCMTWTKSIDGVFELAVPKKRCRAKSIGPGIFELTAPKPSSSMHLLNLSYEVRQNIFRKLLYLESEEVPNIHFQQAILFERPVVYVHDLHWLRCVKAKPPKRAPPDQCAPEEFCYSRFCLRQQCGKYLEPEVFWGSRRMSRLLCINRQLCEELLDLIYSQLAFYIVPCNVGDYDFKAWKN
jgi:hypothetical protein